MFALWQRKIGLSFGWGGGARLEKRLGSSVLKRLSLSTAAISAGDALAIGLCDRLVREADLLSVASDSALAMAKLPSEPVETLKSFDKSSERDDFNSLWWNASHRAVLGSRKR
jgi:enoyl-CoA hydratase/carnithine racemase